MMSLYYDIIIANWPLDLTKPHQTLTLFFCWGFFFSLDLRHKSWQTCWDQYSSPKWSSNDVKETTPVRTGVLTPNLINPSSSISTFSRTRKFSQEMWMQGLFFMPAKLVWKVWIPKLHGNAASWQVLLDDKMHLPYLPSPACVCKDPTSPSPRFLCLNSPCGTQPSSPLPLPGGQSCCDGNSLFPGTQMSFPLQENSADHTGPS